MAPDAAVRAELQQRWQALCAALQLHDPTALTLGRRLWRAWGRWPRRYHDRSHLLACLRAADTVQAECRDPHAVAWALWFHDAVYWPWSRHNERRSADWAADAARALRLPEPFAAHVHALVMATAHGQPHAPVTDVEWVLDIDLGILGQPPAVYQRYAQQVRQEYFWVPQRRWREGRAQVLRHFLQQPQLYRTAHFQQRYEAPARANLQHELQSLTAT